jgi:hypothetical protein
VKTLIRLFREDNKRRRRVSEEEEERLLNAAPPVLRAMICKVVDQTGASWNQLVQWLRAVGELRPL